MLTRHEIEIRVRYQETDAQQRVHHGTYINYFEVGRVELLRAAGKSYKELENEGLMLVVTEISCKYYVPAEYDDLLRVITSVVRAKGVRIEHKYEIFRGDELVCEGHSVVASVGKDGKIKRLPAWLTMPYADLERKSDSNQTS